MMSKLCITLYNVGHTSLNDRKILDNGSKMNAYVYYYREFVQSLKA